MAFDEKTTNEEVIKIILNLIFENIKIYHF